MDQLLFPVGLFVGVLNVVAGGGALFAYPLMLAMGFNPLVANVTLAIGVTPSNVGGIWAYRSVLKEESQFAILGTAAIASGSLTGALALIVAGSAAFEVFVPWLLITSTLLMLFQPRILTMVTKHHGEKDRRGLAVRLAFLIGLYGGYFGPGVGIMLLAAWGLALNMATQRINGLKNLAVCFSNLTCVVIFTGFSLFTNRAPVAWLAALALGAGAFLGGLFGGRVAQRVSDRYFRILVVTIGATASIVLGWKQWT